VDPGNSVLLDSKGLTRFALHGPIRTYRSPWQSPYVERLIGSIRREYLNHVIVFNAAHLRPVLTRYFAYYHESRTHLSLDRNAPVAREVEPPERGEVIAAAQAVLMSVYRTLRLRGHDPLQTLSSALRTYLQTGHLPPLPAEHAANG
jgi:hypothetical protein